MVTVHNGVTFAPPADKNDMHKRTALLREDNGPGGTVVTADCHGYKVANRYGTVFAESSCTASPYTNLQAGLIRAAR